MTTKASIPADGGDATRLLTGQLLVELHLLLSGLVLLLGLLLGLDHVLLGLLLGELGLLVVALLLVLLLFFLLLEQGLLSSSSSASLVQRPHVAGLRGQPDLGVPLRRARDDEREQRQRGGDGEQRRYPRRLRLHGAECDVVGFATASRGISASCGPRAG